MDFTSTGHAIYPHQPCNLSPPAVKLTATGHKIYPHWPWHSPPLAVKLSPGGHANHSPAALSPHFQQPLLFPRHRQPVPYCPVLQPCPPHILPLPLRAEGVSPKSLPSPHIRNRPDPSRLRPIPYLQGVPALRHHETPVPTRPPASLSPGTRNGNPPSGAVYSGQPPTVP